MTSNSIKPKIQTTVIILWLALFFQTTTQQSPSLCPKGCICEDTETKCNVSIGATGLPHFLNPSTKSLVFNNAQISKLSDIDYLGELESLDLANNKLLLVDFNVISKNTKLTSFNLSHNTISELRDSYSTTGLSSSSYDETTNDPKLVWINALHLDLSHNVLTSIRNHTFSRWHQLTRLDLSYNHLTTFEANSLLGLSKLEELNLRGNRLSHIPTPALLSTIITHPSSTSNNPSTSRSSGLSRLDLGQNTFIDIGPKSFISLEHLHELYLDSCSISTIHELAFKGLHTLYLLSLENNNLQEVPKKSFPHISLLRSLKLSSNNLTSLNTESFSALTNLEELQINNGTFAILDRSVFSGLSSLKRLEIAYNPNLRVIEEGAFEELTKLTYLSLYSNSLVVLYNDFNDADSLSILDVRANKFSCECSLKWMTRWLKRFNATIASAREPSISQTLPGNATPISHADFLKLDNDVAILLKDPQLSNELLNITCNGPPALVGKLVMELQDNKLECLEPASELNVHIGFAMLFIITFVLTFVCMVNLCRNQKDLLFLLKKNIVQNHLAMMGPYSQNLDKIPDDMKRETQLYGADYESVDYNQPRIYTIGDEQPMYYGFQNNHNA